MDRTLVRDLFYAFCVILVAGAAVGLFNLVLPGGKAEEQRLQQQAETAKREQEHALHRREAQEVWDKMTDEEKRMIIAYEKESHGQDVQR